MCLCLNLYPDVLFCVKTVMWSSENGFMIILYSNSQILRHSPSQGCLAASPLSGHLNAGKNRRDRFRQFNSSCPHLFAAELLILSWERSCISKLENKEAPVTKVFCHLSPYLTLSDWALSVLLLFPVFVLHCFPMVSCPFMGAFSLPFLTNKKVSSLSFLFCFWLKLVL